MESPVLGCFQAASVLTDSSNLLRSAGQHGSTAAPVRPPAAPVRPAAAARWRCPPEQRRAERAPPPFLPSLSPPAANNATSAALRERRWRRPFLSRNMQISPLLKAIARVLL